MSTAHDLQAMAHYIACYGIHTGVQMAVIDADGLTRLDISAIAYVVTDGSTADSAFPTLIPGCFLDNEDQSLTLIQSSARAMACLRAISDVLDSSVCETEIEPGTWVPDYLEHVSNWAATASPVAPKRPPTPDEVIGRILRAANQQAITAPTPAA